MNEPIPLGSYVKCLRGEGVEEIVRVVKYIDEPSYLLQGEAGPEFQSPASLVDVLTHDEEIHYWRLRAFAAEQKGAVEEKTPIVYGEPQLVEMAEADAPQTFTPGIKMIGGLLVAHCTGCQETEELDSMTAGGAEKELSELGWELVNGVCYCPGCVAKDTPNGIPETSTP